MFLIVSCGTSDTTPPAPPIVDPITSPTPIFTVEVSGTAEFSSIVTVSGGVTEAITVADPYTAVWFTNVQLAPGVNTLSVTATDDAGNTSDPTVVTVAQGALGNEPPFTLALQLAQPSAFVGIPLGFSVIAVDARGNPADQSTLAITSSDTSATVSLANRTITFAIPGAPAHSVTATLFGGTPNEVSATVQLFVSAITNLPPTVTIISPTTGSIFPNDFTVTVTATAAGGLAQIFLQASGAVQTFQQQLVPLDIGTGKPPSTFTTTFLVEAGGGFGSTTLVAQATDVFGNAMTSAAVTVFLDPALELIVGAGITARTVGFRGQLRRPQGVAVDAANAIYVTNNDDASPLVIKLDPAVSPLSNQSVLVTAQPNRNGEDIVFAPAATDHFFITTSNIDRIARVDAAGTNLILGWSASVGTPRGLVVESATSIAAIYDDGQVRRFNSTAAGPNTAITSSMDVSANLGGVWGLEVLDFGCRAGQFRCANTNCIANTLLCNSTDNCGDNSDEGARCAGVFQFRCTAGAVVSTAVTNVCSGQSQCADHSDEAGCSRYAATDAGVNDEAFSFYDNGNGNATAFDLLLDNNFNDARGIARSTLGNFVYVASRGGNAIFQIRSDDILRRTPCPGGCPAVVTGFDEVWGLVFDANGDLIATDRAANVVYKISGLAQ